VEPVMFDSDAAYKRIGRLWRKLGGLYEAQAYSLAERDLPDRAMKCARMAEVCFWQATGEGDPVTMSDLVPKALGEGQ